KERSLAGSIKEKIIEEYARGSGGRGLGKKIGSIGRRGGTRNGMEKAYNTKINSQMVEEILGPPIFDKDLYEDNEIAGVVTGLAWTSVGVDILFIESSLSPGKGKLSLTGNLGDVMIESAAIAMAYLRSHAEAFGIDYHVFDKWDVNSHVPAGATPKDGPSAGITMLTALTALFTQRKVKEKLAM